jgi:hypothetical protein
MRDRLTAFHWCGDAIRSRSVSDTVHVGVLDVPAPPARLEADWEREIATRLFLEPGDVEPLPLARARMRWPDFARCVQGMADWLAERGMPGVLDGSEPANLALMACRGARYHHDAEQYGSAVFCNLFVSDDKGLDVHFPGVGLRVPLARGTALVFDTAQPHAVVRRGSSGFDATHFTAGRDVTQCFLSWELPVANPDVARALRIAFDTDPAAAAQFDEAQVRQNGARVPVCPATGRWLTAAG